MEKARLPILQSSKWSILRRCDGRPARCEPGGSETAEVHRANSHSTWRNGQRAPARRRGRRRPARSDGTRSSDARGVARRGADGVVHSYDGRRRRVRSDQKDARTPQRFQGCAGVRGGELQLAARTFGLRRRKPAVARAPPSSAHPSPLLEDILLRWRVGYFSVPPSRVERTVDLAATRCAVLGARGGGLEPAAATVLMRCVPVHQNEKSNRRSRSQRQPARA